MNNTFFSQHHELFQKAKDILDHVCCEQNTDPVNQTEVTRKISHVACSTQKQARLCSMAMDTILAHLEAYDKTGYVPSHVQEHTIQMLHEIPDPDAIFGLMEDLALITRGHTLFAHKSSAKELEFLQAFESTGEWQSGDGTLISDWYWLRLPALAMIHENKVASQAHNHGTATMQVQKSPTQKNSYHAQRHDAETEALHHALIHYPSIG